MYFQIWPIFAQGGEYGPKYDILDESQKRSEVNEYVDDENNLYFNPLTMTKKDLESLLHQPDPALTVQQLPQNPKISFRKGHPSELKGETYEYDTSYYDAAFLFICLELYVTEMEMSIRK